MLRMLLQESPTRKLRPGSSLTEEDLRGRTIYAVDPGLTHCFTAVRYGDHKQDRQTFRQVFSLCRWASSICLSKHSKTCWTGMPWMNLDGWFVGKRHSANRYRLCMCQFAIAIPVLLRCSMCVLADSSSATAGCQLENTSTPRDKLPWGRTFMKLLQGSWLETSVSQNGRAS